MLRRSETTCARSPRLSAALAICLGIPLLLGQGCPGAGSVDPEEFPPGGCPAAPLTKQNIAGIGIAHDDHVYVWYRHTNAIAGMGLTEDSMLRPEANHTVSAGTSDDFDRYRKPYSYSLPPDKSPEDVVAIDIERVDEPTFHWYMPISSLTEPSFARDVVHVWYREDADGRWAVDHGSSFAIHSDAREYYSLPGGKTPDDIVAMAIAPNHHVYAWYKPNLVGVWEVSAGSVTNLSLHREPYPYSLPESRTPDDVIEMSIAHSNSHVYAWYNDGTCSSGTSDNLSRYKAPYPFKAASVFVIDSITPDGRVSFTNRGAPGAAGTYSAIAGSNNATGTVNVSLCTGDSATIHVPGPPAGWTFFSIHGENTD